jgi:hypothetical protein
MQRHFWIGPFHVVDLVFILDFTQINDNKNIDSTIPGSVNAHSQWLLARKVEYVSDY